MMKINIPKPVPMAMSGKSVLSMMGKSIANIDLLVRESLQNSLDAGIDNNDNKFVDIRFTIGKFKTDKLNNSLNSLGSELNKIIKVEYSDYISIDDRNTIGLNGPIEYQPNNHNYGNFRKLVYEIAKPQQNEDAGGSWGYGKSVYFRMGLGLVIFYSRFKDEDGSLKERLACTYLEDETSPNSLLSKIQPDNRGIAWLGELKYSDGSPQPVEDSYEINNILSIFGLDNYRNNDTGTRIIIPYIDKIKLLEDINCKRENSEKICYWNNNFEDTLKNSILLWYAPRMNNPVYYEVFKKPYLKVKINDYTLNFSNMDNYFYKVISDLYKMALLNNLPIPQKYAMQIEDVIDYSVSTVKYSNIIGDGKAGSIAFCKMPIKVFDASPFDFLGKENQAENGNRPIICFTRKPGMIVDYQLSDKWADKIPSSQEEEIVLGVFVLNSNAKLKGDYRLETYVRDSEGADHTSWSDMYIEGKSLGKIIYSLSKNTQKIIREYFTVVEKNQPQHILGISQKLGKLFLPSTGHGNVATPSSKPTTTSSNRVISSNGSSLKLINLKQSSVNEITIDFELNIKNDYTAIDAIVKGIGKSENVDQWNTMFNNVAPFNRYYPVAIKHVELKQIFKNNSKYSILPNRQWIYEKDNIDDISIELKGDSHLKTKLIVKRNKKINFKIIGSIVLVTSDKGFAYSIKLVKEDVINE